LFNTVAVCKYRALFLVYLLLNALSALSRRNERRALERLRQAHAELSPEQRARSLAQRVALYFSLPADQQTEEKWEWVQSGEEP
jgi:hypothetical protein